MLKRAVKVSLVVGTILNLINSGDALWEGRLPAQPWKIPLTYLVPFAVSLHAGAAERRAGKRNDQRRGDPDPATALRQEQSPAEKLSEKNR